MMKKTFFVYRVSDRVVVKTFKYRKVAEKWAATLGPEVYAAVDSDSFFKLPVPMMKVKNLMTGEEIEIPADTPWCCNPASEAYWSA